MFEELKMAEENTELEIDHKAIKKQQKIQKVLRERDILHETIVAYEAKELLMENEEATERVIDDLRKLYARQEKIRHVLAVKFNYEPCKRTDRMSLCPLKFCGSGYPTLDSAVSKFVNKSLCPTLKKGYSAEEGNNYSELLTIPNLEDMKAIFEKVTKNNPAIFNAKTDLESFMRDILRRVIVDIRKRRVKDYKDGFKDNWERYEEMAASTADQNANGDDEQLKRMLAENDKLRQLPLEQLRQTDPTLFHADLSSINDIGEIGDEMSVGNEKEIEEKGDCVNDPLLDQQDDDDDLITDPTASTNDGELHEENIEEVCGFGLVDEQMCELSDDQENQQNEQTGNEFVNTTSDSEVAEDNAVVGQMQQSHNDVDANAADVNASNQTKPDIKSSVQQVQCQQVQSGIPVPEVVTLDEDESPSKRIRVDPTDEDIITLD